jgi:hypothetical protein
MNDNQELSINFSAIRRISEAVEAENQVRRDQEQARVEQAKAALQRIGAPSVFLLLKGEVSRRHKAETRRPSNANIAAADGRGQMDGFVAALALATGLGIVQTYDLLNELVEGLDWRDARWQMIHQPLAAPSAVRSF